MVPQNSIIRRVRRYTAMATLFRSADPTPTQRLTGQAGVSLAMSATQPSAGVAKATLLPTSSSLPIGHVVGIPSVAGAATFPMEYPVQRTPVPPTPVEPTPARAPEARPSPATPPETGSKTDDAEWRRLQTIFRKHEQRQSAEGAVSQTEIRTTCDEPFDFAQDGRGRTASTQRKPASQKTPPVRREASQPRRYQNEPPPRPAAKVGREAVQAKHPESKPHPSGLRRMREANVREEASRTISAPADISSPQEPPVERSVGEPRTGQPVTVPDPPIPGSPPEKTHQPDPSTGPFGPSTLLRAGSAQDELRTGLVERFSVEQPHRRAQSDERDKLASEAETSIPQRSTDPGMEETVEWVAVVGEPETISVPEAEAPDRTSPESSVQLQVEIGESPQHASHRSVVRPFDEAQGRPRSPQKEEIPERDVFDTDTLEPTTLADVKVSTPPQVEAKEGTLLSESQVQPLPLQAVWPVQRLEEPTLSASPEPPAMSTSVSTSASEPEPLGPVRDKAPEVGGKAPEVEVGPPETAGIRKALRDVAPGQPTDSSIEIIPPRRPRPELVEGPRPVAPPSSARQPPAEPGTATRSPGGATSRSSPVQRRQDGGSDAAQGQSLEKSLRESEVVQTEIGPLPADLWHLLGQSPPRLHPEPVEGQPPHGTEPEAAPTTDCDAAVMRAVAVAEAGPVPLAPPALEQPAAQEVTPSILQGEWSQVGRAMPAIVAGEDIGPAVAIQRRPDVGEEAETEAASQPEAGEAETEAATRPSERQPAEEPDVDELARRVYAEIKRRLSLEWERVRRRG